MYCPNCGKQIDESDVFCRYCGHKITESSPTNEWKRPVSFGKVVFECAGATETEKNWWSGDKVGRGFFFAVSLLDTEGNSTAWDGVLDIVLMTRRRAFGSSGEYANYFNSHPSDIQKAKGISVFSKQVNISSTEFLYDKVVLNSFFNNSFVEALFYKFIHTTPIIFHTRYNAMELHLWFRYEDTEPLYISSAVRWE